MRYLVSAMVVVVAVIHLLPLPQRGYRGKTDRAPSLRHAGRAGAAADPGAGQRRVPPAQPRHEVVDTEIVGRLFGQIGIIVFIMAIGAFISVSVATRAPRFSPGVATHPPEL
jgi:hypothetical protein